MSETKEVKKYYRMEEVEERYPIKRTQIYELIRIGTFTAYFFNSKKKDDIFIDQDEIVAYFSKIKDNKVLRGWKEIIGLLRVQDDRTARKILEEKGLLHYENGRPVLLVSEYFSTLERIKT